MELRRRDDHTAPWGPTCSPVKHLSNSARPLRQQKPERKLQGCWLKGRSLCEVSISTGCLNAIFFSSSWLLSSLIFTEVFVSVNMSQGSSPPTLNVMQKQSGENFNRRKQGHWFSPCNSEGTDSHLQSLGSSGELLMVCRWCAGGVQVACSLPLHRESCWRLAKSSKHCVDPIQPFQISRSFQF